MALGCYAANFGNSSSWPCIFNANTLGFSLCVFENVIDSFWAKCLPLVKLAGQGAVLLKERPSSLQAAGSLKRFWQGGNNWHFNESEISKFLSSHRWCIITCLPFLSIVILHSVLRVLLTINKLLVILPDTVWSNRIWSSQSSLFWFSLM